MFDYGEGCMWSCELILFFKSIYLLVVYISGRDHTNNRSYLLRKQAEWSDQLRHCQKLIHETSAVPSIEYNEFLSLLLKSDDGPRNANKKHVSWSEDVGMQRRSVVVRPHPPPLQKILPPASLEDFFAESDEDNETNNSNKNLVEEYDSDDDDCFFTTKVGIESPLQIHHHKTLQL